MRSLAEEYMHESQSIEERLKKGKTPYTLSLIAENPDFEPIEVDVRLNDFAIEGISVGVIRRH